MDEENKKSLLFLKSSLTEENPFISTEEVIIWLEERNRAVKVEVNKIKFTELKEWSFVDDGYKLSHSSGKFFSIDGIRVQTNYGKIPEWEQPIINQPEIGYLGFITKVFNGILYFLVQAKTEPGNVNHVQLSPTLQATRSNYSRIHKGKPPLYLDYFRDRSRCNILLDQLQSEQGARFLQKRNRNIIIQIEEDIEIHEDFVWLTLGQIKRLIRYDNLINMDTRTVISGIPFGNIISNELDQIKELKSKSFSEIGSKFLESALYKENSVKTIDDIISWITELKSKNDLLIDKIPLNAINEWDINDFEIARYDNKYFKVIATEVKISNREVTHWTQPLLQPSSKGLIAFITKKINGVYHFLVQAKLECGNLDILEMAPTVQCLTGDIDVFDHTEVPFLSTVLKARESMILVDSFQSEEGGRFYQEQNRNTIILVGDDFPDEVPENYCWLTINQLHSFLKYNNYLNIQARSLIASISFM